MGLEAEQNRKYLPWIYLGVFLLVVSLFGKDFLDWYWKLITAAQAQQAGFRAHLIGNRIPLRAADGREQHRVRRLRRGERRGHGARHLAVRRAGRPFRPLEDLSALPGWRGGDGHCLRPAAGPDPDAVYRSGNGDVCQRHDWRLWRADL